MPVQRGPNDHSMLKRLQRETGLDATTCQAALHVLQRDGFARRHVRAEKDARLILRRICDDPKYTSLQQKTEAAKDGAVVLRARHCLTRGNRQECMNEILDAFHTALLSIKPLLNACIHPALDPEEREVVVRNMLASIRLEGLNGGRLLQHLLAYPGDLDSRESFCLTAYAARLARNTREPAGSRA